MRTFYDVGGYRGDLSLRAADSGEYNAVHTFEPMFADLLKHPRVTWHNAAVIANPNQHSVMVLSAAEVNQGTSLYWDKTTGNLVQPVNVAAVYLPWFFSAEENDVHLDCEGAEYAILSDLLETGLIRHVTRLSVEWHADRIPSLVAEHERIVPLVEALNLSPCLVRE